jgi:tetratricopeptide (TPR) repeat protein
MKIARVAPLVGVVAVLAAAPAGPSAWSKTALLTLLDRYAAGEYDFAARAIAAIDRLGAIETPEAPDTPLTTWRLAAPEWIRSAASPAEIDRRRLIAATVALELVHAHPEVPWPRRWSFFSWACAAAREHPTRSAAERLWYLTSVAVAQEAGGTGLLPSSELNISVRLLRDPVDRAEMMEGHLRHARGAFPEESRFRLVEIEVRAAGTSVASYSQSPNWLGANELPVSAPLTPEQSERVAVRAALIPDLARELAALTRYDSVRGEVELNLGYLSARLRAWDDALEHLSQVPKSTDDPFLRGMSHYLRGWVFERAERRDDAIAEYRLALDAFPHDRAISTLLADQLAQASRQAEAYAVLDAGVKASATPLEPRSTGGGLGPTVRVAVRRDPWFQFQQGDARRLPEYIAQLREALR